MEGLRRGRALAGPVVTLAFFAITLARALAHPMWRDELQAWMIARDARSIPGLFENLRYEGHPALWHLLLFGLTRFTHDPRAMQGLAVLVATGSVWLFLRFSPFPLWLRLLFPLGYYVSYEYAVVTRSYGLALLLTLLACTEDSRRGRPWVIAIWLFLLSQTSGIGLLVAFGLTFALLVRLDRPRRQTVLALGIVALGAIACALQTQPPPHSGWPGNLPWEFGFDPDTAIQSLSTLLRAYAPVFWNQPHFFGALGVSPSPAAALGGAWLALFFGAILLPARRVALGFALGTAAMLVFFYAKYIGAARHHGHLLILLLACAWVAMETLQASRPNAARHLLWALAAVLFAQLPGAIAAGVAEARTPFSQARAAAAWLTSNGESDARLLGDLDCVASSVGAYLDRPMIYVGNPVDRSFIRWTDKRALRAANDVTLDHFLASLPPVTEDTVLVLDHASQLPSLQRLVQLGPAISDETYWVYRLRR